MQNWTHILYLISGVAVIILAVSIFLQNYNLLFYSSNLTQLVLLDLSFLFIVGVLYVAFGLNFFKSNKAVKISAILSCVAIGITLFITFYLHKYEFAECSGPVGLCATLIYVVASMTAAVSGIISFCFFIAGVAIAIREKFLLKK